MDRMEERTEGTALRICLRRMRIAVLQMLGVLVFVFAVQGAEAQRVVSAFDASDLHQSAPLDSLFLLHAGDDPAYARNSVFRLSTNFPHERRLPSAR